MIGQYEMKCAPEDITSDFEIVKNLRVCDKHYGSLSPRGHKPAKGKSSSRPRCDAQLSILKSTPCIVTCSQWNNKVSLISDVPYKKHNVIVFNDKFSVASNFLDEINDKTTDLHNNLYTCTDFCNGSSIDLSCQPFFLKSIKIENEYKKAQNTFQQKQGCATSTTQSHLDNFQKQDFSEDVIASQDKQADTADDKGYRMRENTVPDT